MDKLSYALGLSFGQSLRQNRVQGTDYESFAKGVEAMCEGKMPEISVQEAQKLLDAYFSEIESKQQAAGMEQKSAGEKFLAENAKKAGVITTASGLQYEILKEGRGQKPTATDKVKVHYEGKLINGKVFDSSYERGEPIEFELNQVIPGWAEGLTLMPVGSIFELYIPSDLAYGDRPIGEIPAGSTLIFKVELLEIVK